MSYRIPVLVLAASLLSLPGLTRADAPDAATPARVIEYVDHVCRNHMGTQCEELDGLEYTGCECTHDPAACSADPESVPAHKRRCVIDFVPGGVVNVKVTVVADDMPGNNFSTEPKLVVTLLIEGPSTTPKQKLVIAESYLANGTNGTSLVGIGGWNPFANEDEILMIMDDSLGMIPVNSQLAIQDALVAYFKQKTGHECVPLLFDVHPRRPDLETDQSPDGQDTPLATVARYSATIRCANGTLPTE
jgi:hypothetical protein